jgi:molybdate transport system substrate-binding protein
MRAPPRALCSAVAVLGLVVVSCGGDDGGSATTAETPTSGAAAGPGSTTTATASGAITVFAAASLTDAFEEIGEAFTAANPDADVTFSFAGSSDLVAQLDEGAPADVFASADQDNMAKLTAVAGNAEEPEVFATNLLAIITATGNPLGITGVADLADPDLVVVTCAAEVPCGAYAQQVFDNAGVTVTPKSYEENVRGVVNKVTLGEADAGIVYATDVLAAGDQASGVEIPAKVNVVARYPVVTTAEAGNPEAAEAFVDFVLGADGQEILAGYGFTGP